MINDLTKGGQTLLQGFRMFCDILGKLVLVFVLVYLLSFLAILYGKTTAYERYKAEVFVEVAPLSFVLRGVEQGATMLGLSTTSVLEDQFTFITETGDTVLLTNNEALQRVATPDFIARIKHLLFWTALQSLIIGILVALLIAKVLIQYGKTLSGKKVLRGMQYCESKELIRLLKKQNPSTHSELTIAQIPLPPRLETYHFWINGVSGSGKTVAFCDLMTQIRNRKRRAVVYDIMGVYVARFYRPGKDVILNPFDQRSPCWSPWAECVHSVDYEMLAASQISIAPGTTEDPFWKKAARSLYSATLRRLAKEGKAKNLTLLRYLLTADLDKLRELLKNTEAEALVAKDLEKTALSVKAILNDDIKAIRFLQDDGPLFSIRDWIRKDDDDSWIFITSRPDQHETLMPLISTWYDIAITEALSLPDNPDRRIYFPLDELPTLKYLPALKRGMPLGRQKGLCFILGTQGFSQMNVNYGHEEAKTIIGNAGIKIILRSGEDAEKISHSFNQSEIEERNESISYGVTDNRDGVSITNRTQMQYVVLASELQSLENLVAYLRIPGNYPLTKIQFQYVGYPEPNERFESRDCDIDWLIDDTESIITPGSLEDELQDTISDKYMGDNAATNSIWTALKKDKSSKRDQKREMAVNNEVELVDVPDVKEVGEIYRF